MLAEGTDVRQLTVNNWFGASPAWSPDGTRIAFESDRDGELEIYTMRSDATDVRQLTLNDAWDGSPAGPPNPPRSASPDIRLSLGDATGEQHGVHSELERHPCRAYCGEGPRARGRGRPAYRSAESGRWKEVWA